ncbi:MAG: hypothetical protein AB7E05_08150 [Sphingobium sp.]
MAAPRSAEIAIDAPAAAAPAATSYDAGGPVASVQEALAERLMVADNRSADAGMVPFAPAIPHWSERLISGFSRALGPILLGAGFYLVARLFF